MNIALLCGSLRKDSYSRKVANFLIAEAARFGLTIKGVEIADLDLYNEDLETPTFPSTWGIFRQQMKKVDAFLFVTPEYNRSLPAALKNALDVGSRPWDESVWNGKPGGIVSLSQGNIGGFGANHHLRQILTCLNVPMMAQPETYLSCIQDCFDETSDCLKQSTRDFLINFLQDFATWVTKNQPG